MLSKTERRFLDAVEHDRFGEFTVGHRRVMICRIRKRRHQLMVDAPKELQRINDLYDKMIGWKAPAAAPVPKPKKETPRKKPTEARPLSLEELGKKDW